MAPALPSRPISGRGRDRRRGLARAGGMSIRLHPRNIPLKLVCHIGTPKTASTFLQNTFAQNRDWLARRGIVFPDLMTPNPNHITLFYASARGLHDFARDYGLKDAADVAALRDRLGHAIEAQIAGAPAGAHTMLISSENLTGNLRHADEVARLADLLAPHFDGMRFVVYLRRQDQALLSMYAEFMRRGFSAAAFDDFVGNALGPKRTVPYLFYRKMLEDWSGVVGRAALEVRLFDPAEMAGGDILADLLALILGEVPADLDAVARADAANVSLSAPVLEFLRRIHPHLPFRKEGRLNPVRARLGGRIDKLPATPRPQMSAAQSQRIMEHFAADNAWLRDTFFPGRPGPVFPDRPDRPDQGNLGQLNMSEAIRIAAELLT